MSDTLRLLVHELVVEYVDRDNNEHRGLMWLVGGSLAPGSGIKSEAGGHRKVSGSPAPWNSDAAHLWTDIHAGARDCRSLLHLLLFGNPGPNMGTDDNGTEAALLALPDLAAAAESQYPGSSLPHRIEREVARWVRRAKVVLDFEQRWANVPVDCPATLPSGQTCGMTGSLRQDPRSGNVRCFGCGARWTEPELGWLGRLAGNA